MAFDDWKCQRFILLTTFKASGDGVPAPVWFALDDGKLYFQAGPESGKMKRIRRDSKVTVAACTITGKPLSEARPGRARQLEGSEAEHARKVLQKRLGLQKTFVDFLLKTKKIVPIYVEVEPA